MTQRRTSAETRQLLFDACTKILVRDGLPNLTLEAVAAEAGVSKGGLLYHFPTKVALIEALFTHHLDLFDDNIEQQVMMADDVTAGSWLRAYAKASIDQIIDRDTASVFASLFAAGEQYPSVLAIMRERYELWQAQLMKDNVRPEWAMFIRLIVDGLWFSIMYGFAPPSTEMRTRLNDILVELTQADDKHV